MSRAALRRILAQSGLSALPIRPTRLIWSAVFFNQHQKFFVARGTEQGGFNHIPPAKARLRRDKFSQFRQDPFMDGDVANDAAAPVGFGFTGFKLGFDERDDFSLWFQQSYGSRQDFLQRDERAINYR